MSQELNSIIDQLAEIDSASARIMQKAQVEKSKYAEQIQLKKQEFDDDLQKKIDLEVEAFKKEEDLRDQQEIDKCRQECEEEVARLDQRFLDHGDEWADEIFQRILKG